MVQRLLPRCGDVEDGDPVDSRGRDATTANTQRQYTGREDVRPNATRLRRLNVSGEAGRERGRK